MPLACPFSRARAVKSVCARTRAGNWVGADLARQQRDRTGSLSAALILLCSALLGALPAFHAAAPEGGVLCPLLSNERLAFSTAAKRPF